MDKIERIKELVSLLNEASKAYYQDAAPIMLDIEYDKLYDELSALEEETGIRMVNSPTVNVGYEVLSELPKEKHPSPMLSLSKTKEVSELKSWLGDQEALVSWKMDGLTIVLTYESGELTKAVTRGNGEIGEVVTNNARTFKNLPLHINYKGRLVLRGEAVIKYSDFEKINESITDEAGRYKNPRNLCSGSVRQLDSKVTADRCVNFFAFALVEAEGVDFKNSRAQQLQWLKQQGFEVVYYEKAMAAFLSEVVDGFSRKVDKIDLPSDGLVVLMDDIEYGRSLGRTAKAPRDAMAFKWRDELAETTLLDIEWSASRTGLINPVAIFEPVELEGTSVSRASVHNISIVQSLRLGVGDRITVYKANMIIPQIAENLTGSDTADIPSVCPVCGEKTTIDFGNGVMTLHCPNAACPAKSVKGFDLFVSRNALNIDGLSEATIEKFIDAGFLRDLPDIFELERYKDQIVCMEGFGDKSYNNLIESIEKARTTTLPRFIYGLGIDGIGAANAKVLDRAYEGNFARLRHPAKEDLIEIDTIGDVLADSIISYFEDEGNQEMIDRLISKLQFLREEKAEGADLTGKTFVITGELEHFANRDELKKLIEDLGGKVAGSVSSKTTYLINNDITSQSSKNKKAKELGIPIITESQAIEICDKGDVSV